MHLFTYGTLMFPEVWRIVVCKNFETTPANLPGHEIYRVRNALYPGIIKCDSPPSSPTSDPGPLTSVPGLLYHNLDPASLARLDAFEGPEYIRQTITVTCNDGRELEAGAYIVPPERRELLTDEIWTAEDFAARGHLAEFVARFSGFNRLV